MPKPSEELQQYPRPQAWTQEETARALWMAVSGLVQRQSYFAFVVQQAERHIVAPSTMPSVAGHEGWIAYVGLSGAGRLHLFINQSLFCSLTPLHQMFVLRHEVGHLTQHTALRLGHRDVRLYNMASDIVINEEIAREVRGEHTIDEALDDPAYLWSSALWADMFKFPDEETAEWYYDRLAEQQGEGGLVDRLCGDGDPAVVLTNDLIDALTDEEKKALEQYLQGGETLDGASAAHVREVLSRAARAWRANGRGTLPGSAEEALTIIPPRRSLKNILKKFFGQSVLGQRRRTWMRPSRRVPGRLRGAQKSFRPSFWLVVDTSGSMSQRILREIGGYLVDVVNACGATCRVIEIDTEVRADYMLTDDRDIAQYQARGRGGTVLQPALNHIDQHSDPVWRRPSCAVVFTDSFFEPDLQRPPYPVLFVVPSQAQLRDTCAWGHCTEVPWANHDNDNE